MAMTNMTMKLEGTKLIIEIADITKTFGQTSGGKSIRVASTGGNKKVKGTEIRVGLNAYIPMEALEGMEVHS